MTILTLPDDLPEDIATEHTELFQALARHYTKLIAENVALKDALTTTNKCLLAAITGGNVKASDAVKAMQAADALLKD